MSTDALDGSDARAGGCKGWEKLWICEIQNGEEDIANLSGLAWDLMASAAVPVGQQTGAALLRAGRRWRRRRRRAHRIDKRRRLRGPTASLTSVTLLHF